MELLIPWDQCVLSRRLMYNMSKTRALYLGGFSCRRLAWNFVMKVRL